MGAKRPSAAERYRAHRAAFELALELRCTPREAEQELARRAARRAWEESRDRLNRKIAGHAQPHPPSNEDPPLPWWQRY